MGPKPWRVGAANLVDRAVVPAKLSARVRDQLLPYARIFSRNGETRFLPNPGLAQDYSEQTFARSVPRTGKRLLVGPSGMAAMGTQVITAGWGTPKALQIAMQCADATYTTMWGLAIDGTCVRVCRTNDGLSWAYLGAVTTTASTIWAWQLSDTEVLLFNGTTAVLYHVSYADATFTATRATLDGSAFTLPTGNSLATRMALCRFPQTGTLMLGTYRGGLNDTYILRRAGNADVAWVSEAFAPQADGDAHFHGLGYHAATNTMIGVRGDGIWHWPSGSDGAPGTAVRFPLPAVGGAYYNGGYALCDVGLPQELVWGTTDLSRPSHSVTLLDVTTGRFRKPCVPFGMNCNHAYVMSIAKVGDLILFAPGYLTPPASDYLCHPGVWITSDFTDDVEVHQFPTVPYGVAGAISSVTYMGTIGGNWYFDASVLGVPTFYLMPAPVVFERTARLVSGANTNLDTSTQASLGHWDNCSSATGHDAAISTTHARRGTTSMYFLNATALKYLTIASNGSDALIGTPWDVTPGHSYQVNFSTFWQPADAIENTQTYTTRVEFWNTVGTPAWEACTLQSSGPYPQSATWEDHRRDVLVPVDNAAHAYTKMRVKIEISTAVGAAAPIRFYVGAVEVVDVTTPHWPGSVADSTVSNPSDHEIAELRTLDQFTHIMGIQPNWAAERTPIAAMPLRSWVIDASNYLSLCWVPQTQLRTGTVSAISTVTITADATFTAAMIGAKFVFDATGNMYTIVAVADTTHCTLASSAAAESSTDTFQVLSIGGQFQLRKTVAGPTTTNECVTADAYFGKDAMIWLAVQVDATDVRLSVSIAGDSWEHIAAGDSEAGYANALLTTRLGGVAGAGLPAMAILEDLILAHTFPDTTAGKAELEAYVAGLLVNEDNL